MAATRRVPTVGYLVWHLGLRWRVAIDRTLQELDLTHAHYALLASLYGLAASGAVPSQRELADFSGLESMYVSKLARILERRGLLRRGDHPADPRAFQLRLTPKGEALTERAAHLVQTRYAVLLQPLGGATSPRARALMRTLNALLDVADAETTRGGHGRAGRPAASKGRRTS